MESCLSLARQSNSQMSSKHEQWKKNLPQYHAYIDVAAVDKVRQSKARPDATYPGTAPIKIPASKMLGKIYHTYLMDVYTSIRPLFRYTGGGGEDMTPAEFIEQVIEYQTTSPYIRDKMLLSHVFQDLVIYNMACIRVAWIKKTSTQSRIQKYLMGVPINTNVHPLLQSIITKQRIQEEVTSYEGNQCVLIDPFDLLPDTRFPLSRMNEGEFIGSLCVKSWSDIEEYASEGILFNTEYVEDLGRQGVFNRITDGASSLRAQIHSTNQTNNQSTNITGIDVGSNSKWKDGVQLLDIERRLIPKNNGLEWADYDASWHSKVQTILFTIINGQVVCRAEPLTNLHKKFSYLLCELESDGHTFGHRGMMEDLAGFQEELSWYHNFRMESSRQISNGKSIVDPSMLEMSDFANTVPGGYVRKTPQYYGIPIEGNAYFPIDTPDITQNLIMDSKTVYEMAKLLMGINDTMTGQVSSGRHTATEAGAAQQLASNRLKATAEIIDTYFFEPFSDILKQNTQQFLSEEFYNKIVGKHAGNQQVKNFLNRPLDEIMGDFNYMRRDGLVPMNKLQEAAIFQTWYRDTISNPLLLKIFNIVKIFSKGLEKVGIKNPEDYVLDPKYYENLMAVVPDSAIQTGVQSGNMQPMGQPGFSDANNPQFKQAGQEEMEGSQGASNGGY